jgi:hypothetical protein
MLEEVNTVTQLSEAYRSSVHEHNEEVRRNRHILSKQLIVSSFAGSLNFHCVDTTYHIWLALNFVLISVRTCHLDGS